MRHLFCVIISVCCAISIFAAEMTEQTFTVHKQLPFTSAPEQLTLDLYIPKGVKGPVPCIMVIQGGGFKAQNGQKFKPYAEYLAQHNFAAALISYRGLSKHTYRDTIADTKAAVRYVRSVSEQYGINSDKIGAMGRSAGGTLAVLLAVTGDVKDL